jgi:hypothetical protein
LEREQYCGFVLQNRLQFQIISHPLPFSLIFVDQVSMQKVGTILEEEVSAMVDELQMSNEAQA